MPTIREVIGGNNEQRITGPKPEQARRGNSFLHWYLEQCVNGAISQLEYDSKAPRTAVVYHPVSRPGRSLFLLLLLVHNYIHIHNTSDSIVINWVQEFNRGWIQ